MKLSPRQECGKKCEKCLVNFGTWLRAEWVGHGLFVPDVKLGHRELTKCHPGVWAKMRRKFGDNLMTRQHFVSSKVECMSKSGLRVLRGGNGDRRFIYFYFDNDIARTFLGLRERLLRFKSSHDVARHACQLWNIFRRQMFITFMNRSQRQRISAPLVCPCPKD